MKHLIKQLKHFLIINLHIVGIQATFIIKTLFKCHNFQHYDNGQNRLLSNRIFTAYVIQSREYFMSCIIQIFVQFIKYVNYLNLLFRQKILAKPILRLLYI